MSDAFEPGLALEIAPGVVRVVAPNPGPLTGPGTNTYLVGDRQLAVIDPGPADAGHVAAIVAAGGGRIAWILVSHTHRDHSPAARLLRERTGATVVGRRAPAARRHDRDFRPDAEPADGERVLLDGAALRCVATPGHASNHVCFLLEGAGILFTGDHILGHVSPVIVPPDGDMTDYLESLSRLKRLGAQLIAPGHGPALRHPARVIDDLVGHRLAREGKVRDALDAAGPASVEQLVPAVYQDVDPALHGLAAHTLLAHLLKLERDGRARQLDDATWAAHGGSPQGGPVG